MKKYRVERYFDTYPDGGDRVIEEFDNETDAKKLAADLNFKNMRPYVTYEVREYTI